MERSGVLEVTPTTPLRKKALEKEREREALLLSLTEEERTAKQVRASKRRQSIQAHKQKLDHSDMAAGLRGTYGPNGREVEREGGGGSTIDSLPFADGDEQSMESSEHSAGKWVAIVAGIGLKENLGKHGEKAPSLLTYHHPSATPTKFLSHDWKSDPHSRSGMFALRAGTAHLHSDACADSVQPWKHTENMTITGSDVNKWWTGWIEGAIASGNRSSKHILHFLDPPVPVANHIERRYEDMELVKEIERERLEEKREEKEKEKMRLELEAKERQAAMFKY